MTTPSAGELALLRTHPQLTRLYLSIYNPRTVFAARVNNISIAKNDKVIAYDSVTTGNYLAVQPAMTLWVGTTLGGREKGSIYVYGISATEITVGENSHIDWDDNDYITVVNFFQIWPLYPRYVQDDENITVYKAYDKQYTDENTTLGEFINMGPHHAGFLEGGEHQVYWSAVGTEFLRTGATGSYLWTFEGATVTGSSSITPGYITYDAPGHYLVKLRVADETGHVEVGARHVSIYDRPEEGTNVPILKWGMDSFSGSRVEGGYSTRLWVEEQIDDIVDGALVVIFADDWYGDTKDSIGGNATNRENTVFCGYILDGTIDYDYANSRVTFDVGSPSEVMKLGEAFSVSVEDSSGDPETDANQKGGDPWFYLPDLTVKKALYHYIKWHTTVNTCNDVQYVGDDFAIQFFDADRTSIYDALNSLLRSAVYGAAVCDRQGKLYFEIEAAAKDSAETALTTSMFVDSHDWINQPQISERHTGDLSYLEGGGVAYYGFIGATGSYEAFLASAPGSTPSYRGSVQKLSGFALTTQDQLNTLVGNIFAFQNSTYPEVRLDIAGNYRVFDIAPQEIAKLTVAPDDTHRGITWTQKAFVIQAISWTYDSQHGSFLPQITVAEVTQGFAGDTIVIPAVPDEGWGVPPVTPVPPPPPIVPPEIPPIPGGFGLHQFMYTLPGTLEVNTGLLRCYNRFGTTMYIREVHISEGTAPSSGGSIIDVNINGSSMLISPIALSVGLNETYTNAFAVAVILPGQYFTVDVDTADGTDLAVVILAGML